MSFTQTGALQFGASTLKQALAAMGLSVSEQAFFWLLGQAYGESGLGLDDMAHMPSARANFLGTNNWGAVYCGATTPKGSVLKAVPDATCKRGAGDQVPGGASFVPNVTKFASPVDGAKGFTSFVMAIPGVTTVFKDASGTTNDFARALYRAGYFGGCHVGLDGAKSLNQGQSFLSNAQKLKAQIDANPDVMISCAGKRKGSSLLHDAQADADEANIREYASMVDNMANVARKAVGSSPLPIPILVANGAVDIPPSSPVARALKIGFGAAAIGGAAVAIAAHLNHKKETGHSKPSKMKKGKSRRA
jgi:hypothetical protein